MNKFYSTWFCVKSCFMIFSEISLLSEFLSLWCRFKIFYNDQAVNVSSIYWVTFCFAQHFVYVCRCFTSFAKEVFVLLEQSPSRMGKQHKSLRLPTATQVLRYKSSTMCSAVHDPPNAGGTLPSAADQRQHRRMLLKYLWALARKQHGKFRCSLAWLFLFPPSVCWN